MNLVKADDFCCNICFNVFGGRSRCPRILPCGHTFCQSCLEKKLEKSVICPTCHKKHHFKAVKKIPVNKKARTLSKKYAKRQESLTVYETSPSTEILPEDDFYTLNQEAPEEELYTEGACKTHELQNTFQCSTCSSYVCDWCVQQDHKLCSYLPLKESVDLAKKISSEKVLKIKTFQKKKISQLAEDSRLLNQQLKITTNEINKLRAIESQIQNLIKQKEIFKTEKEDFNNIISSLESSLQKSNSGQSFRKSYFDLNQGLEGIGIQHFKSSIEKDLEICPTRYVQVASMESKQSTFVAYVAVLGQDIVLCKAKDQSCINDYPDVLTYLGSLNPEKEEDQFPQEQNSNLVKKNFSQKILLRTLLPCLLVGLLLVLCVIGYK